LNVDLSAMVRQRACLHSRFQDIVAILSSLGFL
jgi:hypothetical protein